MLKSPSSLRFVTFLEGFGTTPAARPRIHFVLGGLFHRPLNLNLRKSLGSAAPSWTLRAPAGTAPQLPAIPSRPPSFVFKASLGSFPYLP